MVKKEERAWFRLGRNNGLGYFEEDRRWSRVVGGCGDVGLGEEIRSAEPGFVKIGIGVKGKEKKKKKKKRNKK